MRIYKIIIYVVPLYKSLIFQTLWRLTSFAPFTSLPFLNSLLRTTLCLPQYQRCIFLQTCFGVSMLHNHHLLFCVCNVFLTPENISHLFTYFRYFLKGTFSMLHPILLLYFYCQLLIHCILNSHTVFSIIKFLFWIIIA